MKVRKILKEVKMKTIIDIKIPGKILTNTAGEWCESNSDLLKRKIAMITVSDNKLVIEVEDALPGDYM